MLQEQDSQEEEEESLRQIVFERYKHSEQKGALRRAE